MTAFYPVFLDLRGRRAVVIGGGAVAEQKVHGLVGAGAHVTVVSTDVTPALGALARRNAIEHKRRPYRRGDIKGAWLAIAATGDRGTPAAAHRAARGARRGPAVRAVGRAAARTGGAGAGYARADGAVV